jgi:hypothetical protein
MWQNSFDADGNVKHEMAAWILKTGILVLPTEGRTNWGSNSKNGPRVSSLEYLPLSWNNFKPSVKFDGTYHAILGTIHSHPNTQPWGPYEAAKDHEVQNYYNVPVFLIRTNGFYNLDGRIGSQADFFNGTKSLINGK